MKCFPRQWSHVAAALVGAALGGGAGAAAAEESGADLRAATQNPISSLISLPFKFTFDSGADNGDANILSVQPVIPVTVGEWNLVNRLIVPLADAPDHDARVPGSPLLLAVLSC